MLCSATLELTQDDIDGGTLNGVAFARGEASDGQMSLGEDYVEQVFEQAIELSVGETAIYLQSFCLPRCLFHRGYTRMPCKLVYCFMTIVV